MQAVAIKVRYFHCFSLGNCGKQLGCGAAVKMTQLCLRSSSFYEHGSSCSSGAPDFHECSSGSGALFFIACLRLQLRLLFVFTH